VDFLPEPIDVQILLGAVTLALNRDIATRARTVALASLRRHFSKLTLRERQVLALVIGGMRNKQSAAALGIKEVTLEAHRGRIMRKMAASSFAELVRMSVALGILVEPPPARQSWCVTGPRAPRFGF
jgi:FixJ family two-component response regulator